MKNIIVGFLLVLTCSSCASIYLNLVANKKEVNLETFYNADEEKTVVFVPMVHLSRREFYEDVKTKLDSLRKDGFVVFFESVKFNEEKYSPEKLDSIHRKFRKIRGFHLTSYNDSLNKNLPKAMLNSKYVTQTRSRIGITDMDKLVDLPLDSLILLHEEKYGEIVLTECDLETDLNDNYKCDKLNSHYIVQTVRNDHIKKTVLNSEYKKIALVYGRRHFDYLRGSLAVKGGYSKQE